MAPQVGLEPTTLRLTAVQGKNLKPYFSIASERAQSKFVPQLSYEGYHEEVLKTCIENATSEADA